MRHLVLAAIMAVGVGWFMGIGDALGRAGERSGNFAERRKRQQHHRRWRRLWPRLAPRPVGSLRSVRLEFWFNIAAATMMQLIRPLPACRCVRQRAA